MRRWTLAGLMGIIVLVAMGLAAMREATVVLAEVVPYLVGGSFAIAGVIALLRRCREPEYLSFAVFGGSYFLASVPLANLVGPIPGTSPMVDRLAVSLEPRKAVPAAAMYLTAKERHLLSPVYWETLSKSERAAFLIDYHRRAASHTQYATAMGQRIVASRRIGHSLLSHMIGLIGAFSTLLLMLGRWKRMGSPTVADSSPRSPIEVPVPPEIILGGGAPCP